MTTKARAPADRLLEGGWLAIALLVPLVINPWGESIFSLPKAVVVRTVVLLLVAVWTADRLLGARRPTRPVARLPLALPAVGLLAVIALATVFARAPELSFWGSSGRSEGALTLVCFPILALLLGARLSSAAQAERLFWTAASTTLPLAVYAGLQLAGPDPFGVITDARSPVFATLGRSNFLAAYAAMLLPLTLTLLAIAKRPGPRALAALFGVLQLVALVVTRARAGWLATLVAAVCWAALVHRGRLGPYARATSVRVTVAILAAVALAGGLWLAQVGGSGAARLAIWQGTQKLVVQRPLLGYGPDSLGLVFPRVYPPELVYHHGRGLLVDRAHNLVLDWMVTLGTLGLVAAVAFLFVVLRSGWRSLSRSATNGPRELLVAGALAALAGNLAGNLVSFDVLATLALGSLLMGTVVGLERDGRAPAAGEPAPAPIREPARRGWRVLASVAVCLVVLSAVWVFNFRPLMADVLGRRASALARQGQWEPAEEAARRSIATFSFEPDHRQRLGWIRLQRALQRESPDPAALAAAQQTLEEALARRPDDYRLAMALAEFHGAVALRFDRRHLGPAEEAWKRATTLAPNHGLIYLAWGKLRLQSGNPEGAATLLREAVDLDTTDAEAWLLLANLELGRNRPADALVLFRQAAAHAPSRPEPLVGLAQAYWSLGQPEAARETAREALALDPGNGVARALLEEFSGADRAGTEPEEPGGRR